MDKVNRYRLNVLFIVILISLIGLFMVYDSSKVFALFHFNDEFYYFKRQLLFLFVGFIGLFIGYKIPLKLIKKHVNSLLIISYISLMLVIVPGIGIIRGGSSSWLGFNEFSFQPSELFKIALIIFYALYLSKNFQKTNKLKNILLPLIMLILGSLLIMLQPDFGTCMVIILAIIIMLFCTRLNIKYFIFSILLLIVFMAILILIAPYRLDRITSFINPFEDPLGSGFQMIQSLFSISPGGLIGLGINGSIQKHFYLPEPMTDFIFAIIVEEFGLVGGLIVIILYGLLFYYSLKIIINTKDLFQAYFSLGLLALFLVQVLINLGVVVGVLPITGITLPLISYGGSSLCVLLFSFGLLLHKENQ